MRPIRRIAATLSSILLLQLTLIGSGTLCTMRGGDAQSHSPAMVGMTGTAQNDAAAGTAPATRTLPSDGPKTPLPCGDSDGGCGRPWAPGQCASMSACTVTTTPVTTVAVQLEASQRVSSHSALASLRSRPAAPPELPPPRRLSISA